MKLPRLPVLVAYLTVYIAWGSTYLAIKWVVQTFPVFYLVGMRFLLGGMIFLVLAAALRKFTRLPSLSELGSAAFLGVFLLLFGNGFISQGLTRVDSYLAAIIIAATPFCVAFFNRIFFGEKISGVRLFGITLGFFGVMAILYNGKNPAATFNPWFGFILAGFVSWGFATSMGHRLPVYPNNLANTGLQMFIAGIIAMVYSRIAYGPVMPFIELMSVRSAWALAYLVLVGSFAYYAYVYLLAHEPSIRIVSYAIVNPLIAVLLGLVFDNEKPVPLLAVGMPVILIGLAFMLYGEHIVKALVHRKPRGMDDESFDHDVRE